MTQALGRVMFAIMKRELLDAEAITTALTGLPGWEAEGNCLRKTFSFPSYMAGIAFVQSAAEAAERMNHHPDLHVGWRKVGVSLSTHSAGGITELDLELARLLDAIPA